MPRTGQKGICCLVCDARSGQLFPFCEWCGAKHSYTPDGEFLLTGQICQVCGYQAEVPFARCPKCHASRHVLCPACGASAGIRRACRRCGLHHSFFDKVRRDERVKRGRRIGGTLKGVVLAVAFLLGAAAIELRDGAALAPTSMLVGLGIALTLGALLYLARKSSHRVERTLPRGMSVVLESYDPAEVACARMRLADNGIAASAMAAEAALASSVPPAELHRLIVARHETQTARAILSELGFNVVTCLASGSRAPARPVVLRVIEGGRSSRPQ